MINIGSQFILRPIDLMANPDEVAAALIGREGLVFLDSVVEQTGSFSLVACEPDLVMRGPRSDWPKFRSELANRQFTGADNGLPIGAAIGWTAYDGEFCYGFYRSLLIYSHRERRWFACGEPSIPEGMALSASVTIAKGCVPEFRALMEADRYCEMVTKAQAYIASGDIYQVCLAHEFRSIWTGSGWPFYQVLRSASPAPYAAYLNLVGTEVLCTSPECFLEISGRRILTRPIKGTRPRGASAEADERAACDLITSPKEIAELVMITDLERNDLGRVCDYGTVRVRDLLSVERYEQVFHMVSTVEGILREDVDHATAVSECFPGGSISGAPKKRAMEVIAELEPTPRGIYTGAIGCFGFNGETRLNIAIRSVFIRDGVASFHVGAGIVADSVAESEWQETLDKASGILLAAAQISRTSAT